MDPNAITYGELLLMWSHMEERKPVIFYGATDAVARGTVYEMSSGLGDEALLVIHPDDLPLLYDRYPGIRFVHLENKPIDLARVAQRLAARANEIEAQSE
jgi:hypothetical protein